MSRAKQIKRRRATRRPAVRIVVVAEGSSTERGYFVRFNRLLERVGNYQANV